MRISKETNIGYVVITIVAAIPCFMGKVSWWTIGYFPAFYFILWLSLRETKKEAHNRRRLGVFKHSELSDSFKKTIDDIENNLNKNKTPNQ